MSIVRWFKQNFLPKKYLRTDLKYLKCLQCRTSDRMSAKPLGDKPLGEHSAQVFLWCRVCRSQWVIDLCVEEDEDGRFAGFVSDFVEDYYSHYASWYPGIVSQYYCGCSSCGFAKVIQKQRDLLDKATCNRDYKYYPEDFE